MYLATVNSATAIPVSAARRLIRGAPYTRLGFPPLGDPKEQKRRPLMRPPLLFLQSNRSVRQCLHHAAGRHSAAGCAFAEVLQL